MEFVPLSIGGDSAVIPLTRGRYAIVDRTDWDRVSSAGKWCAIGPNASGRFYAVRREAKTGRTIYMHRFIAGDHMPQVDHDRGGGLDNRRENLRPCTPSQNGANRARSVRNSSGFAGVSWHAAYCKWEAYIHVNYVKRCVGFFDSPSDAAKARDDAAVEAFGMFATVNFERAI